MSYPVFAIAALVPMMVGQLPQEGRDIVAQLCGRGEIVIPIERDEPGKRRDCHQKACHAASCRQKGKKPV